MVSGVFEWAGPRVVHLPGHQGIQPNIHQRNEGKDFIDSHGGSSDCRMGYMPPQREPKGRLAGLRRSANIERASAISSNKSRILYAGCFLLQCVINVKSKRVGMARHLASFRAARPADEYVSAVCPQNSLLEAHLTSPFARPGTSSGACTLSNWSRLYQGLDTRRCGKVSNVYKASSRMRIR